MRILHLSLTLALAFLGVACRNTTKQEILAPADPGLRATPSWLTFQCVRPGCDTTLTATISVVGTHDLAVKRIVLSDRARTDVVVTPHKAPPFVLKTNEKFTFSVTYQPTGDPRLADLDVVITYTDAAATESADRVKPGDLKVPIVRRLVGEPRLAAAPTSLVFGAVLPGHPKTLPLHVTNSGFGNVGVVLASATSDLPDLAITNLPVNAILPGASWDLEVTFTPTEEAYSAGYIELRSEDPTAAPTMVGVVGTSIPEARLLVTPERGLDFGDVARGAHTSGRIELSNQGAADLAILGVRLTGGSMTSTLALTLPRGALARPLHALGTITATIALEALAAGPIDAHLLVTVVDTATRTVDVPIIGTVTQPTVAVTPGDIDFGNVPRGWNTSRSVEVSNAGYGDLEVTNATLVLGSSTLFTLHTLQFPVFLRHAQRAALEVEFRAETEASFDGILAIETNDPDNPSIEVPLHAAGVSCDLGCPIAHGQPSCTSGMCAVGSCDDGFSDADGDPTNGCECAEQGRDPGGFCMDATDLGTISDTGDRTSFSGVISSPDDVDLLRFFGRDDSQFLDDDYDVRVNLQTTSPDIEMCVYRHDTGSHQAACILDNESCGPSFSRGGSWPGDDSADYVVKIRQRAGTPPACASYTVFVSNG